MPVVAPPTSSNTHPSSRSSSVRTASELASGSSTRRPRVNPARSTDRRTFCAAVVRTETRYISTSRRVPLMPTGSVISSCSSTV